ncbi:MAG TPA: endonuclease III [Gemmatimonadales bacterium]|nr:endonuclease III [Gemmatimonadales bacterium]
MPRTRRRKAVAPGAAPARERIGPIITKLRRRYPHARCALEHRNPLELLVATILSAQCTDARVNLVTRDLFARYTTAEDYAGASPATLEEEIRSTGFFRNKTRAILGMAQALVRDHGGQVPRSMEALTALPGVGRKTANVVLGNAFGLNEGVVVDTHVQRLSRRLRLTTKNDPVKIEHDLMSLVPRRDWTLFSHLLIHHGRQVCQARVPRCELCPVNTLCPSAQL